MTNFCERAAQNLIAVRAKKPLIHNITNFVVMNYTANALLALGASPVMAHAAAEVEEIVALADALVLNLGTLNYDWIDSMIAAGRRAGELGKPIVLDPVGSGATAMRTRMAKEIIARTRPNVIRANASETLSLRQANSQTKGVDSLHSVEEAAHIAQVLARELGTTLAITGPVDLVTDGKRICRIANGHPLMGRITGTGCSATVTIGAFLVVDSDPVSAAATGLAFFGLAGEVAARTASAPGSYMIALLDALYTITPQTLREGCKIHEA